MRFCLARPGLMKGELWKMGAKTRSPWTYAPEWRVQARGHWAQTGRGVVTHGNREKVNTTPRPNLEKINTNPLEDLEDTLKDPGDQRCGVTKKKRED